jgi:spore germination protein KB
MEAVQKEQQIEPRQFFILVLLFTIGTAIIVGPHLAAADAHQDGWIAAIVGLLLGIILVGVYATFGKRLHEKTLVEMTELVFGKWIGSVISLLFVAYLIVLGAIVLINISHFTVSRILIKTPIVSVEYIYVGMIIFATILGLEVLARAAEVLVPFFFFLFLLFVIGQFPHIDLNNVRPVLENGFYPVIKSSFEYAAFVFGELVIFLMMLPFVSKKDKLKRYYISGTALGGFVIFIVVALSLLVLGANDTIYYTYPTYTLAKKIGYENVIQRVEVIMAGIWYISIFFKLSLLMRVIIVSLKQIFRLRSVLSLSIPIGMSFVPISLWLAPNVAVYFTSIKQGFGLITLIIIVYPLIVIAVGWIRERVTKNLSTERNLK